MHSFRSFLFLLCIVFSCLIPVSSAQGQDTSSYSPFSLHVDASFDLPIGANGEYYTYGGSTQLSGLYTLKGFSNVSLGGQLDYALVQMQNSTFLSKAGIAGKALFNFPLTPLLSVAGFGQGGYTLTFADIGGEIQAGGIPFFGAGVDVSFHLSEAFALGIHAAYRNEINFYSGFSFGLGTKIRLKQKKPGVDEMRLQMLEGEGDGKKFISVELITFNKVFPVFYKYYDDHPVGVVTLKNISDVPLEGVTVETFVNLYMDTPKINASSLSLQPGEEKEIELFALFNNKVLEITEATKVAAEVSVRFPREGRDMVVSKIETLRIYDRNALTWDDDRKAAAFISSKDPSVLGIAKNMAGIISRRGVKVINNNLMMGMVTHAALPALGLSYVIDPQTPYRELSTQDDVVDFLQYPRQTLYYRAGDCDDLSILYCSFLEAVGIETAFITIPGHIFIAFSTGLNPEKAQEEFSNPDELIFHSDLAWIPVEVTMIDDGFLAAWKQGAKEWRENISRDQARIIPVHEAWQFYEPTGISAGVEGLQLADVQSVGDDFYNELIRFVNMEIDPKVSSIKERIKNKGETAALLNKMGVVYARYGRFENAEDYFNQAVEKENNLSALINLGNILFLQGKYIEALDYYELAYDLKPESSTVLLSLARVNHELENYGTVRIHYSKLQERNPGLATQFAYLDMRGEEAGRAAEAAGVKNAVIWDEEE